MRAVMSECLPCSAIPANPKARHVTGEEPRDYLVGAVGFEPTTLWSQTRCATRLRYTPEPNNHAGLTPTSVPLRS